MSSKFLYFLLAWISLSLSYRVSNSVDNRSPTAHLNYFDNEQFTVEEDATEDEDNYDEPIEQFDSPHVAFKFEIPKQKSDELSGDSHTSVTKHIDANDVNDNHQDFKWQSFTNAPESEDASIHFSRVSNGSTETPRFQSGNKHDEETDSVLWKEIETDGNDDYGKIYDEYALTDRGDGGLGEVATVKDDLRKNENNTKLEEHNWRKEEQSTESNAQTNNASDEFSDHPNGTSTEEFEDRTGINETNIYIGRRSRRTSYITTVTIPTFVVISVLVSVMFLLLHIPNCCFGVFREPDWETYGQPKEEESDYDVSGWKGCLPKV